MKPCCGGVYIRFLAVVQSSRRSTEPFLREILQRELVHTREVAVPRDVLEQVAVADIETRQGIVADGKTTDWP
jgi:hypothetical protein